MFSGIAMRSLLFCPPLRTALVGAGSKPAYHGVLMLPEMCIAHIFCPPLNARESGQGVREKGHQVTQTPPSPLVEEEDRGDADRGGFFGKPLRSLPRFRHQDAHTPPSPRVGEGGCSQG
jgi:hypothetical protein